MSYRVWTVFICWCIKSCHWFVWVSTLSTALMPYIYACVHMFKIHIRAGKRYEVGVAANICSVRVYIYINNYIYIRLAIIGLDFLVQHLPFVGYLRYLWFLFGIDIGKPNVNHLQCGHGWDISNHPNMVGLWQVTTCHYHPFLRKKRNWLVVWKICFFFPFSWE